MGRTLAVGWKLALAISFAVLPTLRADSAPAFRTEQRVAAWVLSMGGSVTLHGDTRPISSTADIPSQNFVIRAIDLQGSLVTPDSLSRLEGLRDLRELYLPGTMWNLSLIHI